MEAICQFFRTNYILANCEDAIRKKAFTLNLSHFQMVELPDIIEKCETLMKLFINQNKLTKVPNSLGSLIRLQVLALDYNQFDEFPACICELVRLKFLNISCNNIRSLPPELGQLTALETFWCNNTGLEKLPNEIVNCERLQTLGVRGNRLKTLPDSLGKLSSLRWLTAENNELRSVPQSFGLLINLIHLNLKGNRLGQLPDMLISMPKLRFVFLNDNRIDKIPAPAELKRLQFVRMLNLSKNPISTKPELQQMAHDQQHIYIEMMHDEAFQDSVNNSRQSRPYTLQDDMPNHENLEAESSSDWENSARTSQLDSSEESTLENTIEDIGVMLPEMSRFITTF